MPDQVIPIIGRRASMGRWQAFHNANHIHAGMQMCFYELVYDPDFTVNDMKADDELTILTPNGTRSRGSVVAVSPNQIVIRDHSGTEWILMQAVESEKDKSTIYPDMVNTIWTVKHRRL